MDTKKYIFDYLTGEEIDITHKPEELVRQKYLKILHEEYGYPKDNLAKEVSIKNGISEVTDVLTGKPKRADIVVYKDSQHKYDEIYIIIECKQPKIEEGEAQAKSYGNCTTASIVVWNNGDNTKIWERTKPVQYGYKPKLYLPRYGEYYGQKKIKKSELKPATDLQLKFKKIHNNIYANTQSSDKTHVFNQMLYLIFIKMYDEKLYDEECKFFISDIEEDDILKTGYSESFGKRIFDLFEEVKTSGQFSEVFSGKEEIDLLLEQVAYVVSELEYLSLLFTDVKGEAFQAFINNYFRGDAGQFFTPDPIKNMMVDIIKPIPNRDTVYDPACGSGGFLVSTINYFRESIKNRLGLVNEDGSIKYDSQLNKNEKMLVAGQIKELAGKNILGTDFDNNLTKIAKMYMIMVDDGHGGIFTANSLIKMSELTASTGRIKEECCDVILTNPPFGTKGKISRKDILENYDLGYKWKKETTSGKYNISEKIEKNLLGGKKKGDGQIPDVLFIERCYHFLKPGGRMGIVLPDGDLSNQTLEHVRQWLVKKMLIVGVISLPAHTFVPFGAGPKSSVLICIKPKKGKIPSEYPVFFGKLSKIGYDVRGKVQYKRDENGSIIDSQGNIIDEYDDTELCNAAIDSDIPELLNKWNSFYEKNKNVLW
jgi:type I restriction enzyme M protein